MNKKITSKINGIGMSDTEIIDAILDSRGIDDVTEFIRPSQDAMIPFEKMKGLDKAYQIISDAIMMGERFLILADVDADGCTANAIMARYLRKCGADVTCVINKGKEHGAKDFDLSLLDDIGIMIIVDSLNNEPDVYKRILDTGVRLIVFDHHLPEQRLFDANLDFVLVSSANDYPNDQLSGAGVCMKYALYADEMNLTDYAEDLWVYAAIGLISDMSSMAVPENRYMAYRGLAQYNNPIVKKTVGNYMFDSKSVGFSIGPLVNAAMRMSENEKAMNIFLADDEEEIAELVKELQNCRERQNNVVSSLIDGLIEQGESQLDRKCMFFILDSDIDAEITGLLGNKLIEQYQRPLFILKLKDGVYTGSMRSVGTTSFLEIANSTGKCLCQGHPNAAGAFINVADLETFKVAIEDCLKDYEFSVDIEADIEIEPWQINENLIKQLNAVNRVSGNGFKAVTVLIKTDDYTVGCMSGGKHLKVTDNPTGMIFVKWGDGSYKELPTHGELIGVGTLSTAYYGRTRYVQCLMNDYTINASN